MTLTRTALFAATLIVAAFSTGCATTPQQANSNQVVRYGTLDSHRNPLALGAGDTLGVALYMAHDLD